MGTSSTGDVRPNAAALQNLAATVHTYESFGRAVISHVLAESSNAAALQDGGVPAQFAVKPMTHPAPTFGPVHCVTLMITIGSVTHYIEVCSAI